MKRKKLGKATGILNFECDDGFKRLTNNGNEIDPEFEFLADELEDAVREMSLEEKEEQISDYSDDN